MEYKVEEVQPNVWRVSIGSVTRFVRYRSDSMTFAPWDVTGADGQTTLWSAASLASAFRWIQARTGYPVEALFAQALLERSTGADSHRAPTAGDSAGTAEGHKAVGD